MTADATPYGILCRALDPAHRNILASLGRYSRHYDGWYLTVRRERMARALIAAGAYVFRKLGWRYDIGGEVLGLYEAVAKAKRMATVAEGVEV